MDAIEALMTRKSTRGYLNKPVHADIIAKILLAASYTPSGTNTQPWHVAVLANESKKTLNAKLLKAFWDKIPRHPDYNYYPSVMSDKFQKRKIECGAMLYQALNIDKTDHNARLEQWSKNYTAFDAPIVLYIFTDKSVEKGSFMDCGMFIQSLMLAATSLGLASCPMASLAEYPNIVRQHLQYDDDKLLLCGIALGYEDTAATINNYKTNRIALNEFVDFFN